ncbi:hypothetical protein V6N00_02055 [Tersicoccus sp. MR15.9]|uniref:hypothetical protein n=1 Tax=Tersicoccus mangrovi TaxID=3121635 RepID=UPI002FE69A25
MLHLMAVHQELSAISGSNPNAGGINLGPIGIVAFVVIAIVVSLAVLKRRK